MSAVIATASRRNRNNTPSNRFVRSGPFKSTSFKETPANFAEESNTTLTFPGFFGWYTPKKGRYQRSLPVGNGCAISAWPFSIILWINWTIWSFFSVFEQTTVQILYSLDCLWSVLGQYLSIFSERKWRLPMTIRIECHFSVHMFQE